MISLCVYQIIRVFDKLMLNMHGQLHGATGDLYSSIKLTRSTFFNRGGVRNAPVCGLNCAGRCLNLEYELAVVPLIHDCSLMAGRWCITKFNYVYTKGD